MPLIPIILLCFAFSIGSILVSLTRGHEVKFESWHHDGGRFTSTEANY